MLTPLILFEDEDILILNKPAGWITNDATTVGSQPTVQSWLRQNLEFGISNLESYRSGIVHRLDKETSGILIVAKTSQAFENLQAQFKNREVTKSYLALLHGKLEPTEGKILAPVGRLPWRRDRFGVLPGGREAETRYNVLRILNYGEEEYSLVEFFPKTGRTHQIRIHAKHLGHPIVGDSFYAGRKQSRKDRKWAGRLFLHAFFISFSHPKTNKKVDFRSDLAEDLQSVLKLMDEHS